MKPTNIQTGLTNEEAAKRKKNINADPMSRTYRSIIFRNTFTFFNLVNFILAALVFYTKSYRNMLFMGVVLSNMFISIVQEIRAKSILDKLALLNQDHLLVLRNGKEVDLPISDIVQGDILILKAGDQIPCDGKIVEGQLECSEAILTGESDSIEKECGSSLLSGSYVLAGQAKMEVEKVGEEVYIHSILKEAKQEKQYPSQLKEAIQTIIKTSTILIIPIGLLLLIKQYYFIHLTRNETILSTVAALVGMIPEGLVILTSIALALASIKLAKKAVLVQELYCIETLARVNVLCLDKTGTITEGKMKVVQIQADQPKKVEQILANMYAALPDSNSTAQAIRAYIHQAPNEKAISYQPFKSETKQAKVVFSSGTYLCGAYSFIFEKPDPQVLEQIQRASQAGQRVLALAQEKGSQRSLLGLIEIQDVLRPNIRSVFAYFQKQDVEVKIISGDDPMTVQAIAKEAGIEGKAIDLSQIDNKEIPRIVKEYQIFGRVRPEQKKAMIIALKNLKYTVAMSGDGVNDVMALKEADCSIAMGSGSQAARHVASLVLLNDQFESMPSILEQGRCVINNIQRSASLFLVKTIFSSILAILTIFVLSEYPFQPIQLTLISSLAIGIPSFVLTLEPDKKRVKGHFLFTVFSKAIPGGLCIAFCVLTTYLLSSLLKISHEEFSTICTILAGLCSLMVLYKTCLPLSKLRLLLIGTMSFLFLGCILLIPSLFFFVSLTKKAWIILSIGVVSIPAALWLLYTLMEKIQKKFLEKA